MIPITRLSVGKAEADAAAETIRSGWLTQGKIGQQFERAVAEYVGVKHAIATNSCTTALHLALVAAGVGPGDEVICPSFTFIATANAIVCAGATPIFVDIEPRTFNIDPRLVEAAITPRTRAIVPVSQIGLPADLPAIRAIASRHKLVVVEDAAPSLGAMIGSARLGSISDFTCFSFDARKILTMGEGGVITTDNDASAERLRALRAHAASISAAARHSALEVVLESYPEVGYNYKLTDVQASIGLVQMGRLESIVEERRRLAARYHRLLVDESRVTLPWAPLGYRHVFQSYCVRLHAGLDQQEVMAELAREGVASRRIMAVHLEPAYRGRNPALSLPVTEAATARTILLPIFVGLSDVEQRHVATALRRALDTAESTAMRNAVLASAS